MTWHGDQTEGRVTGEERALLLAQREALVKEIQQLGLKPIGSKSAAALQGRQDDLLALAKKVKQIDKKLGRA